MKKVKIVKIDSYYYTLYDGKKTYVKNIEIYSNNYFKENDVLYISERILNEDNLFAFADLFQDNTIESSDIIKVVSNNKEYYLQRIYG